MTTTIRPTVSVKGNGAKLALSRKDKETGATFSVSIPPDAEMTTAGIVRAISAKETVAVKFSFPVGANGAKVKGAANVSGELAGKFATRLIDESNMPKMAELSPVPTA